MLKIGVKSFFWFKIYFFFCAKELLTHPVTLRSLECHSQIRLNNKIIEFKNRCKFLGMNIDDKFNFNNHTEYIASKISKSTRFLYIFKDFVPQSNLIKFYNNLTLPYLNYCSKVFKNEDVLALDRKNVLSSKMFWPQIQSFFSPITSTSH